MKRLPRKGRSNGAKGALDRSRRLMAGASEAQFATTGPVGQVVKTAASHAVNIGSNPVRVTKLSQTMRKAQLNRSVKE